ncbi:hypothetical protein [Mucilaginibacter lappiensis]|uniref:Uncharacterized protein n=1 Tax=Mucilaginibacter lappiensis TaxID=354630 RepID=A0A841JM42_9SPHI|nr:hypothetical protein [Mucilaginibacter lappiensis]MBB6131514.1 hypothetical protein [Mucilaginibacter lappiensis]
MKKFAYLSFIAMLSLSCGEKSDDQINPVSDKIVRIEIGLTGDYSNYMLAFSISSLFTSSDAFVAPVITCPAGTNWTQAITAANTFNYIEEPVAAKLVIKTKDPVRTVSFLLSATQTENMDDKAQVPLSATIQVYANDKLIETDNYTAKPGGEYVERLTRTIKIN